jgi:hypothetical protein
LGGDFPRNPKKRGSTLSLVIPLFSCSKKTREKSRLPEVGQAGTVGIFWNFSGVLEFWSYGVVVVVALELLTL